MPGPHDALIKDVLGVPEHAAGILRSLLPPGVAERLDWSTLMLHPVNFIEAELDEIACDLLYEVRASGERPVLLYLLVEHQSSNDLLMPFRLLRYTVEAWRRWLRAHEGATRLPPVVPMVIAHAPGGWHAPASLFEMLDADPELLSLLKAYLPDIRPRVEDLSARSDQELRDRSMSAHALLGLLVLKNARSADDFVERLAGWLDLFREIALAPQGIHTIVAILRYIFLVSGRVDERTLLRMLSSPDHVGAKLEEAVMTVADKLREEGYEKGIAKGDLAARRDLLLRQMTLKFRELSVQVRERIAQGDRESLDRWAERVLFASTPEEVVDG